MGYSTEDRFGCNVFVTTTFFSSHGVAKTSSGVSNCKGTRLGNNLGRGPAKGNLYRQIPAAVWTGRKDGAQTSLGWVLTSVEHGTVMGTKAGWGVKNRLRHAKPGVGAD